MKRERSSSDNVEAVESSADNPKQACPSLSLTVEEAEHGGGKQSVESGAETVGREDPDQPKARPLEQGTEGGDVGDPARWHVQLQSGWGE